MTNKKPGSLFEQWAVVNLPRQEQLTAKETADHLLKVIDDEAELMGRTHNMSEAEAKIFFKGVWEVINRLEKYITPPTAEKEDL